MHQQSKTEHGKHVNVELRNCSLNSLQKECVGGAAHFVKGAAIWFKSNWTLTTVNHFNIRSGTKELRRGSELTEISILLEVELSVNMRRGEERRDDHEYTARMSLETQ